MSTIASGLILFRRPTMLLGALVLTSMLCTCGGGGGWGTDSALGPDDGANTGTPPVDDAFDGFSVYGSTEPDGSAMCELNTFHGHEAADGTCHYYGTESFPYILTALRWAGDAGSDDECAADADHSAGAHRSLS
ncbi:MAG TPA: hypothetical protein DIC52_08700 [Candidatus Latescibacteria bacterium]|nr:hypothetical protein [Candidatus Latescibacterota bacterium]